MTAAELPQNSVTGEPMKRHRRGSFTEKLPPGVRLVGRPSRYGNPYKLEDHGRDEAMRRYRADLETGRLGFSVADAYDDLAGSDLACYCSLDDWCHADVLLEAIAGEHRRREGT